jgi:hypothetical protein
MIFIRKQIDTWVTQAQQQGCICQTGGTPSLRMRHPAVLWERVTRHHHTLSEKVSAEFSAAENCCVLDLKFAFIIRKISVFRMWNNITSYLKQFVLLSVLHKLTQTT